MKLGVRKRVISTGFAVAVGLAFAGTAKAADPQGQVEGTWTLVMRKLPDGTALVPPAIQGVMRRPEVTGGVDASVGSS